MTRMMFVGRKEQMVASDTTGDHFREGTTFESTTGGINEPE
jgi:hypothetical protein